MLDIEIKKAIDHCPRKETGTVDALEERIRKMENDIECGSLSAKEEKVVSKYGTRMTSVGKT